MGVRVFVAADSPRKEGGACIAFTFLWVHVCKRTAFLIKRLAHEFDTQLGGKVGGFARGDFCNRRI